MISYPYETILSRRGDLFETTMFIFLQPRNTTTEKFNGCTVARGSPH